MGLGVFCIKICKPLGPFQESGVVLTDRGTAEREDMSISTIGNTYTYVYNRETKKLSTTDGSQNDFVKYFNGDIKSSREVLQGKIEEMQENIENGDVDHEPAFQIGASEFTEKEWDLFLDNYDKLQDDIREAMRIEHEKRLKESQEEAEIQKKLLEEAEEDDRIQKEDYEEKLLKEHYGIHD